MKNLFSMSRKNRDKNIEDEAFVLDLDEEFPEDEGDVGEEAENAEEEEEYGEETEYAEEIEQPEEYAGEEEEHDRRDGADAVHGFAGFKLDCFNALPDTAEAVSEGVSFRGSVRHS